MPANTRSNSGTPTMATYGKVSDKIDSSSLTSETKQIFRLMIELFKSVTNERDAKVVELDQKVELNRTKSDESIKDMQQQIDHLKADLTEAKSEIIKLSGSAKTLKDTQDAQHMMPMLDENA